MKRKKRRRWYSISVDTVRLSVTAAVILALLAVGFVAYNSWREARLQQEAGEVLEETQALFERLRLNREARELFRSEYDEATASFRGAREAFDRGDYGQAVTRGRHSRDTLLLIRESLGERGAGGEAQFVSVLGGVEYRRGDGGRWLPARSRVILASGDYVRTAAGGSAEIMFFDDGTLFVVKPETQVVITRKRGAGGDAEEQAMTMEYGWVNLSTSRRPGKVSTPAAEARVERDSEAFVRYEQSSRTWQFGAYRGQLQVASRDGEERLVAELQQVVQRGDQISEPRPLPDAPALRQPADNYELDLDKTRELVLQWDPTRGVDRYVLQVSENHHFVDNVIEDRGRAKVRATVGVRGEGSFLWRVAALGTDGIQGPWSPVRRFRVVSLSGRSTDDDHTPPTVQITSMTGYGNIYIVKGKTEPGATVFINEEAVKVDADGTFTKTVQLAAEGRAFLDIRASDAWGNEVTLNRPVFVETP